MSFTYTRSVSVSGCGMPMMLMRPMMPMMAIGGCCGPRMPIFGCCNPYYAMGGAAMAGACVGAALATPGVMSAIGSGLKWGYNNIIQPVWNGVIKPVANWTYNNILKPIGSGLKWVWDHTLGWVLKKIGEATSKKNKKPEGTEQQASAEQQAVETTKTDATKAEA